MTLLFIAPLPPPTHGQSLAAEVLCRKLRERHDVRVVDMAKPTARTFAERIGRVPRVLGFLRDVFRKKKGVDLVYLTISESVLGNLKDICIYLICFANLPATFIQLLGGAGMTRILEARGLQYRINKFFISRMRGIIVEGPTQAAVFSTLIPHDKVHVVPNFAEDFLFLGEDEVRAKFADVGTLSVLFLSNLLVGKGHYELLEGYLRLAPDLQRRLRIVFVGGFASARLRDDFLGRLDGHPALVYLGEFIGGNEKKALYKETHVFCLPTYYPYEGQPISILEAYATGCVVVTTAHSGIQDVFADGVNGFLVEKRSAESIARVLEGILMAPSGLAEIAVQNRNQAHERYRTARYLSTLMDILSGAGS